MNITFIRHKHVFKFNNINLTLILNYSIRDEKYFFPEHIILH